MRLCLILVLGLFSGCITVSEIDNAGMKTTRNYVLFVPVKKTVTQTQSHQQQADTTNRQVTASSE
jgi:hypothetical protein